MSDEVDPQKRCRKCSETKPIEMFAGNGRQKDGLNRTCNACVVDAYHARLEKVRAYHTLSTQDVQKRKQSQQREQPKTNRTIVDIEHKAKRVAYDTHHKFMQAYREATREALKLNAEKHWQEKQAAREAKIAEAQARREAKRIFVSDKQTKYQRRKAWIIANGGSHTKAEIQALLEAQNYQCAYCKRRVKLTEDHIIPVTKGGSDYISNICMACWRCNHQKRARTPAQWIKRWYLLEPYNPDAP